jgi:hypothetical protein
MGSLGENALRFARRACLRVDGSQVGGSRGSVIQDFAPMSYSYSKPLGGHAAKGDPFTDMNDALPLLANALRSDPSTDRAIDAALRSVPLPDGLMTRLGMFVYTLPDNAADQADYLGC